MVLTYLSRYVTRHFIVVRKAYLELVATEGFQHGATLDNDTFYLAILLLVLFHNVVRKETPASLVGERNCASYDVVVAVDSGQSPVTDRVG